MKRETPSLFENPERTPPSPTATKRRGGYYTAEKLAAWLCKWAIRTKEDRVLEPSSGDGVFLEAACRRLVALGASPEDALKQVQGVEIVPEEVKKGKDRLKNLLGVHPNGHVACGDFFDWSSRNRHRYTCVVGNPPFIRYQHFPEKSRDLAMGIMKGRGLTPNKLTNIWVPFVVGATGQLAEDGRMALVLPAELLQVTYAAQLRVFLADHFDSIHIYACNHLFFEGAEQEVVLLLAEGYSAAVNGQKRCLIGIIETETLEDVLAAEPGDERRDEYSTVEHSTEKWLKYFLKPKEIDFMRAVKKHAEVATLEAHATIDVGVVTGRNEFFVVTKEQVARHRLGKYVMPLVARSSQTKGAVIGSAEWEGQVSEGLPASLLVLGAEDQLPPEVRLYIDSGERAGYHKGYKCSIRTPWYAVPAVWVPDCFFFRQIYDFPRVVVNEVGATSTDTIHRMRCKGPREAVAANCYTHLTAASAEIEGRSYGGGVLELEPNEAEKVLVPRTLREGLPLAEVDRLIRAGRLADVLDQHDRLILRKAGFTVADCRLLRSIWVRMRDRRMSRRKG